MRRVLALGGWLGWSGMLLKRSDKPLLLFMAACGCFALTLPPLASATEWSYVRLTAMNTNLGMGVNPNVALAESADGAFLYGTTYVGGCANAGTVFRIDKRGGNYTTLHCFTGSGGDGKWPRAPMVLGSDGSFYGTTTFGGSADHGTVFKVNPDGSGYLVLWNFTWSEGGYPCGALMEGTTGDLYGIAESGGTQGKGTVFKLDKRGSDCVRLHSFGVSGDGSYPHAGLMEDGDGVLYGTTSIGGTNGFGTVFKLNKDGTGYTVLKHFTDAEGSFLEAALLEGDDGALYGTAFNGGVNGGGTIFKLNKDGNGFSVLKHFDTVDGAYPVAGLIKGNDGALYGTTLIGGDGGGGTVFTLRQEGNHFDILRNSSGSAGDGQSPRGSVILGKDGSLYGTTAEGGEMNLGTVFALFPECRSWIANWTVVSNSINSLSALGAANASFRLQSVTNLEAVNWLTQATNQASAIGMLYFTNLPADPPQRFYRLLAP